MGDDGGDDVGAVEVEDHQDHDGADSRSNNHRHTNRDYMKSLPPMP